MCRPSHRPLAVILAQHDLASRLARLFSQSPLDGWNVATAQGPEHARFLAQVQACDALLVDHSGLGNDLEDTLGYLARPGNTPVLFLSEEEPHLLQHALARGIHLWLPRSVVLDQPGLLAEALQHLGRAASCDPVAGSSTPDGNDWRLRVERLADLLWHSLPTEGRPGWLSQRYLLERLHEEVVRSQRHGTPFTIVLAELKVESITSGAELEGALRDWVVERVLRGKRRSDVVGHYGLRGFLLLLPHTPSEGGEEVSRRLRRDLEQAPWRVRASLAVAGYSGTCRTASGLLRLAEERLDAARIAPASR
jgi:GGDEF domain-containing protein